MPVSSKATQEFVPIKEIKEGAIILKDGGLRAVIMASSVNFALKSEDERKAITYRFQDFLNSLDFSVQIVVQSRKFDIRPYIALLEEREKIQFSELMKIQTREYVDFVKTFTESTNIMTKNFFIVVPYSPALLQGSGKKIKFAGLFKKKNSSDSEEEKRTEEEIFNENRTQLEQRISVVEQGLVRSSIRVVRLGTEEIIELFYKIFNPGETESAIKLE